MEFSAHLENFYTIRFKKTSEKKNHKQKTRISYFANIHTSPLLEKDTFVKVNVDSFGRIPSNPSKPIGDA